MEVRRCHGLRSNPNVYRPHLANRQREFNSALRATAFPYISMKMDDIQVDLDCLFYLGSVNSYTIEREFADDSEMHIGGHAECGQ